MKGLKLKEMSSSAKLLVVAILLSVGLAYLVTLVNVYAHTQFNTKQIVSEYAGDMANDIYPPEFKDLIRGAHVHIWGHISLFSLLAFIFLLTSYKGWLKKLLFISSFFIIFLDQSSFFIMRYLSPKGVYVTLFSGDVMGIIILLYIILPIIEILKGNK